MSLLAEAKIVKAKKEKVERKSKPISKEEEMRIRTTGKSWYKTMIFGSDYTKFDNFSKWFGSSQ